jgi:heme exporter protein C
MLAGLMVLAVVAIFVISPTEESMGEVQRILYVHVAVAWCGLAGFLVAGGSGLGYLIRRDLRYDQWSRAAAEVGWLCETLTLVTGSLWAHEAWGTWWTFDPRLTTSLILWIIYAAYFLVRGSLEDRHQQARLSAVVAILGTVDIPLIVMATRWFRGMHPTSPEMPPVMRLVLLTSVLCFTALFAALATHRRGQLRLADAIASLERRAGVYE